MNTGIEKRTRERERKRDRDRERDRERQRDREGEREGVSEKGKLSKGYKATETNFGIVNQLGLSKGF